MRASARLSPGRRADISNPPPPHPLTALAVQHYAHAVMPPEERQEVNSDFKPNLINTVCFLANFIIQVRWVGWGGALALARLPACLPSRDGGWQVAGGDPGWRHRTPMFKHKFDCAARRSSP